MVEDLVRIRPLFHGCYNEAGNIISGHDGGGRYISVGARYKYYAGKTRPFWAWETHIIPHEDMVELLKKEPPIFKMASEITLLEIDLLKEKFRPRDILFV